MDRIVFIVQDGMGKNIMGTVPLRGIKAKYPKAEITVVASHPEVFRNNPNVFELYAMQATPNFYENHRDAIVMCAQPYYHPDYISGKKHLSECWCEMLGVPFDGKGPEIFLNPLEEERGLNFIRSKNKPVFVFQWQGGAPPQKLQDGQIVIPKMFIRNLHQKVAQNIASELSQKYHVIAIEHATQPHLKGVEVLNTGLRDLFSVIKSANKVLCIDSFCQHACAAVGKKATVCWCGTNPDTLGYKMHENLRIKACNDPECGRPNSFLLDTDFMGKPWDCPYGELCTRHDEQDILNALTPKKKAVEKGTKDGSKAGTKKA